MRLLLALALVPLSSCDCAVEPLAESRPALAVPALLDFGAIGEGTSVARDIVVENGGAGALEVNAVIAEGTSADFVLETTSLVIDPRSEGTLSVRFSPLGAGEDGGSVVLASNDTQNPEVTVLLHGGPIEPVLSAPAEVDFAPADASLVARTVTFTNDGLALLHIESSAIDVAANPQFSAPDAPFDVEVLPGASVTFDVTHSRSTRADDGRLLVRSNDPDDAAGGGVRAILLHPDPLGPCEDGADNDGDLLSDFPDDPGCADRFDESEQNAVECVDTATQICGSDTGLCESGLQTCVGGQFGECEGETVGVTEACNGFDDDCDGDIDEDVSEACVVNGCAGARLCEEDGPGTFGACLPASSTGETCNGLDDDCDGAVDNGVVQACVIDGCAGTQLCIPDGSQTFTACQPDDPGCTDTGCGNGTIEVGEQCDDNNNTNGDGCSSTCTTEAPTCDVDGTWTLTTTVAHACCDGIVSESFSTIEFENDGTLLRAGRFPLLADIEGACPSGGFAYSHIEPGGCTETYVFTGQFVDENSFSGTYEVFFTGDESQCACFDGFFGSPPCTDRSFTFSASR